MAKKIKFISPDRRIPSGGIGGGTEVETEFEGSQIRERGKNEAVHFCVPADKDEIVGPCSHRCGKCGRQIMQVGLLRVWTDRESLWDDHASRCVPAVPAVEAPAIVPEQEPALVA